MIFFCSFLVVSFWTIYEMYGAYLFAVDFNVGYIILEYCRYIYFRKLIFAEHN